MTDKNQNRKYSIQAPVKRTSDRDSDVISPDVDPKLKEEFQRLLVQIMKNTEV